MARNRVAAALFLCAAFGLSAMWFVFLFVAQPQGLPTAAAASQAALFAFTQSPAPWFFALMAICPLVLIALAFAAWRAPTPARGARAAAQCGS